MAFWVRIGDSVIISCHGDCPEWRISSFVLDCVMGPLSVSPIIPFSSTLEKGMMGEMFGPKREEITEDG